MSLVDRIHWLLILTVGLSACAGAEPMQVSSSDAGAFEVSLAASNDVVTAVWYDTRDGNAEIYARSIEPSGTQTTSDWRLTESITESYVPAAVRLGPNLAVTWYERADDGQTVAWVGLWSPRRELLWKKTVSIGEFDGRNPVVLAARDRLFVAWITQAPAEELLVVGQWLDASADAVGETLQLGRASDDTRNLNGTVTSDGRILIVFDARNETTAQEIFLAEISAGAIHTRRLSTDDGFDSRYPDIAAGQQVMALSWQDERDGNSEVYLHIETTDAVPDYVDTRARRITTTPGQSIGAYLAAGEAGFALVWCDDTDGDYDVFLQMLDGRGELAGGMRTLRSTPGDSLIPAVTAYRGGYVIAWNEIERSGVYHSPDTRSEIFLLNAVH